MRQAQAPTMLLSVYLRMAARRNAIQHKIAWVQMRTHFINRRECELVLFGMKCKARIGVKTGRLDPDS